MADDNDDTHKSLLDVELELTGVLGTATMKVNQILKMGRGAVVMLDRTIDEDIELKSEGQIIARGEVVVVEDMLAVSISKIYKSQIKG